MIENDISFSKFYEYRASINIPEINSEISGTLSFSDGKPSAFKTDSVFDLSSAEFEFLKQNPTTPLKCFAEGSYFTLFDIDISGNVLYPNFIEKNDQFEALNSIEILLSGFSTWLNETKRTFNFESEKNKIIKNLHDCKFSEEIIINKKVYTIESSLCYETNRLEKQNYLITEYTTITVKSINENIDHKSAQDIAYKIKNLFSLLLGYELNFENIWVQSNKNKRIPFYFCHQSESKDPFDNSFDCLLSAQYIDENDLWGSIIANFFSNQNFEKFWRRLPFLFSFKGVWEYEVLAYISLLDAYCSNLANKNRKKLNKKKFNEIKKDLLSVLDRHQSEIINESKPIFDSFKSTISDLKNTDLPTFKEKFSALKKQVDPNILEIIELKEEQFEHIRVIRNQLAHGQNVMPKSPPYINYEFMILDKIRLLLTYLYFKDLGINEITFLRSLRSTAHRRVRSANLNRFLMDKLIGDIPFFTVSKSNFSKVSEKNNSIIVIKFSCSKKLFEIDQKLSDLVTNDWFLNKHNRYRKITDYVKTKLKEFKSVKHHSKAYITCGKQHKLFYGACLITIE